MFGKDFVLFKVYFSKPLLLQTLFDFMTYIDICDIYSIGSYFKEILNEVSINVSAIIFNPAFLDDIHDKQNILIWKNIV